MSLSCFSCGALHTLIDGKVGFREECEKCSADLHACKNCRFYDVGSYNECKESSAGVVREKERANYCDYFVASVDGGSKEPGKEDLLAAAEALFKKL